MGVLLVSRVTARFLRKFKQSCRRGTSQGRVQKARRTSTLISRSFLRARPTRFLICFFSSLFFSFRSRYIFIALRLSAFSMQFRRKPQICKRPCKYRSTRQLLERYWKLWIILYSPYSTTTFCFFDANTNCKCCIVTTWQNFFVTFGALP